MSYKYEASIKEAINIEYHTDFSGYMNRIKEIDRVYAQAAKADENEAKNKELLEELQYLRKVNDDLVWQRDTDEEHEAKAKAFDAILKSYDEALSEGHMADDVCNIVKKYESGESDEL